MSFEAHMSGLGIIKLKALVLIKWSYGYLQFLSTYLATL